MSASIALGLGNDAPDRPIRRVAQLRPCRGES